MHAVHCIRSELTLELSGNFIFGAIFLHWGTHSNDEVIVTHTLSTVHAMIGHRKTSQWECLTLSCWEAAPDNAPSHTVRPLVTADLPREESGSPASERSALQVDPMVSSQQDTGCLSYCT